MKSASPRVSAAPWGQLTGLPLLSRVRNRVRGGDVNAALVDQAIVSLANFLCNVLLARALGLSAFGIYSLAWMGVLFLNGLQIAAVTAPMMSIGPKQASASLRSYYGALLTQAACFAVLSGLVLFSAVAVLTTFRAAGYTLQLAAALAAAGFGFQLQDFARRYFFVTGRAGRALWSDAVSYVGQFVLIAGLAHSDVLTTERALWCSAVTSIIGGGLLLFELPTTPPSLRAAPVVWRQHWPTAKWLTGSAVLQWFSGNQLFTVAAAASVGVAAAGAMKAAQNIMGVLHVLFQGLENVLPAEAAKRFHRSGVASLLNYLQRLSAIAGGATLLVVLAAFLMPELWLRLLYGEQIVEYAFVLRWYAIVYLLVFIGTPLRACLRALEATKPIFWSTALATGFSVATAHWLTAHYGLHGAMLGIAASFLIMQATLSLGTVRQLQWSVRRSTT